MTLRRLKRGQGAPRGPGGPPHHEWVSYGSDLVAVSASPAPWHLAPADGLLVDPKRSTVQLLGEETANRLLIAGCDPATSVLARHLQRAHTGLVSAPVNSSAALGLLQGGLVHVA